jgi:hypothetical protein
VYCCGVSFIATPFALENEVIPSLEEKIDRIIHGRKSGIVNAREAQLNHPSVHVSTGL